MEKKSTNEDKDIIKVLDKTLYIIEIIKNNPKSIGVNEISKLTNIHPSTAYRILKTLKMRGWVFQDKNGKYLIGDKILNLPHHLNFYAILKEVSYYVMKDLSNSENQAMNLVVRNYEKCFILQQTRTEKLIDYVPPIGTELPIYASACGKILLSELPRTILEEILKQIDFKPLTKFTITNKDDFLKELENIRARGYALDVRESVENGMCIAMPVRNSSGEIIAGLSFSGFISEFKEKEIKHYYELLTKASEKITNKLIQYQEELGLS